MTHDRRTFLKHAGLTTGALSFKGLQKGAIARVRAAARRLDDRTPEEIAHDEDFWREVQAAYTVDRGLIHLNNGGVSPQPDVVQDTLKRYWDLSNMAPSWTMWRVLQPGKETVRRKLAAYCGVSPDEVAITRNASESLEIPILGLDLEPGDEVLTTTQDYPRMRNTLYQRREREGIAVREIALPVPATSPDELVNAFVSQFTERTKVLLFCHVVNITGQILPAKRICAAARERGILTIVDGAHSFAHVNFQVGDLGCDYFGTSLHKWLSAPFGTGMLYVRKDRIAKTWPLMAAPEEMLRGDDVRKFEEIGTYPVPIPISIGRALEFHRAIGRERVEARLRRLKNYWAERLLESDRVRLLTSLAPEHSCGVAVFDVEGIPHGELYNRLFNEYRIITSPIKHEKDPPFQGLRVTPHLYTSLHDLDQFVAAVREELRRT